MVTVEKDDSVWAGVIFDHQVHGVLHVARSRRYKEKSDTFHRKRFERCMLANVISGIRARGMVPSTRLGSSWRNSSASVSTA